MLTNAPVEDTGGFDIPWRVWMEQRGDTRARLKPQMRPCRLSALLPLPHNRGRRARHSSALNCNLAILAPLDQSLITDKNHVGCGVPQ